MHRLQRFLLIRLMHQFDVQFDYKIEQQIVAVRLLEFHEQSGQVLLRVDLILVAARLKIGLRLIAVHDLDEKADQHTEHLANLLDRRLVQFEHLAHVLNTGGQALFLA